MVPTRGGDAPGAGVEAEEPVELRDVRPRPGLPEPQRLDEASTRVHAPNAIDVLRFTVTRPFASGLRPRRRGRIADW
ncbi:MAG TPA: hypothetical protein VGD56_11000, partial [Gemmatirosa sp.]